MVFLRVIRFERIYYYLLNIPFTFSSLKLSRRYNSADFQKVFDKITVFYSISKKPLAFDGTSKVIINTIMDSFLH